jgi:hypothetical protein
MVFMGYMDRVRFFTRGGQRKFLDLCIERLDSPSLRGLLQFGFEVNYSSLKNYYSEDRLLPLDLFEDLLEISGISRDELEFEIVKGSWGQEKGGRISKRK